MQRMGIVTNLDDVQNMLEIVDPYNNQKMTYSEVVHLLSSHLVAKDESNPQQLVPVLEKFVNMDEQIAEFEPVDE